MMWVDTVKSAMYPANAECPAGLTWNEPSKICFNSAECLAKNCFFMEKTQVTQDLVQCEEGCAYEMQDQPITSTLYTAAGTVEKVIYEGYMLFIGEACLLFNILLATPFFL
jgi:hypothetical protein